MRVVDTVWMKTASTGGKGYIIYLKGFILVQLFVYKYEQQNDVEKVNI